MRVEPSFYNSHSYELESCVANPVYKETSNPLSFGRITVEPLWRHEMRQNLVLSFHGVRVFRTQGRDFRVALDRFIPIGTRASRTRRARVK